MELALAEQPIPPELIRKVLREATVHMQLQPVLCGSALHGIGVQPVLDAVQYYLPSPLDVPPVEGESVGEKADRRSSAQARRQRAVLRPGVQGAAGQDGRHPLGPRLFRRAQGQQPRAQSRQGHEGKRRPALAHSRHEERRASRKRRGGRHRRHHRHAAVDHRRHDLRHPRADPAGNDQVSRNGHLDGDRARIEHRAEEAATTRWTCSSGRTPRCTCKAAKRARR